MKEQTENYAVLIRGLKDSLELLRLSGVAELLSLSKADAENKEGACVLCRLSPQGALPPQSADSARIVFVLGSTGSEEAGGPFGDEEGAQLSRIIKWMAKESGGAFNDEKDACFCFAVKCAPEANAPAEAIEKCSLLLKKELEEIKPEVVVLFGEAAAKSLLGSGDIGELRGKVHAKGGFRIIPTHGLLDLIKTPGLKKQAQADLELAIGILKRA